jgi:hypothetical protein
MQDQLFQMHILLIVRRNQWVLLQFEISHYLLDGQEADVSGKKYDRG